MRTQRSGALVRIFYLICGTGGNAIVAFLTQTILTRHMPVAEYGKLVALMSTVTLLIPIAGASIGWFWLELYGREGHSARRWGPAALKFSAGSYMLCCLLLAIYVWTTVEAADTATGILTLWISACVILAGQTLAETRAVSLQLEERFVALSLWQSVPQLLRSASVMVLLLASALSGSTVLAGYAVASMFVVAMSVVALIHLSNGKLSLSKEHYRHNSTGEHAAPETMECLKAATPYCLVTLFYLVYSQGIVTMVELMLGKSNAAYYNVSYLVYAALALVPSVVYSKFLAAKIFRWWSHDRQMFIAVFHLGVFAHLVLGTVIGAVIWLLSPYVIPLLFGEKYHAAVHVMQILAIAIPIRFIQHGYGSVLFSKEHIARKVKYMGMAAAISAVAMLVLTPHFGLRGAAASAVIAESVLLALYVVGAARHVDGIDVTSTFKWRHLKNAYNHAASNV